MENIPPAARNDTTPVARNDHGWRFVEWSPVVLGALAATALSSVLVGFGVTVGLGISSTAPTWRDASAALAILSGVYLILQAIISFGVGGYLAGRVRAAAGGKATVVEETERADGVHGLGAWALAVVMGAILATLIGTATVSRTSSLRSGVSGSTRRSRSFAARSARIPSLQPEDGGRAAIAPSPPRPHASDESASPRTPAAPTHARDVTVTTAREGGSSGPPDPGRAGSAARCARPG